jgi:hypothetical protein
MGKKCYVVGIVEFGGEGGILCRFPPTGSKITSNNNETLVQSGFPLLIGPDSVPSRF